MTIDARFVIPWDFVEKWASTFLWIFFLFLEEKRLCLKKEIFKKSYPLYFWYPQNKYV